MIENKVDQEAFNLLSDYRDNQAIKRMETAGGIVQKYNVDWIGRDGLNPDTHEAYLTEFVNHFYKNIVKMIDRAMKKENINNDTPLVYEILFHLHECNRSASDFAGRELELRKLKNYLHGDSSHPFFVFGKGGSGKTGLLSKVFQLARTEWIRYGVKPVLVIRFCGTTPDSNSLLLLLQSICQQLCYNFNISLDTVPTDLAPIVIFWQDILSQATEQQPVVVILDSVDEIATDPDKLTLSWIPHQLPKHCKVIYQGLNDNSICEMLFVDNSFMYKR